MGGVRDYGWGQGSMILKLSVGKDQSGLLWVGLGIMGGVRVQ